MQINVVVVVVVVVVISRIVTFSNYEILSSDLVDKLGWKG